MRNSIIFQLNQQVYQLSGEQVFMTVADFLRYQAGLTGTKIVCAEGDCGACSILVARFNKGKLTHHRVINSCITFMYLLDGHHIITVEGLKESDELHPVQAAMVNTHGAQCGYCTPGFICALAGVADKAKREKKKLTPVKVKNALTGNLCRCTGYDSIIKAGCKTDLKMTKPLKNKYDTKELVKLLEKNSKKSVEIRYKNKVIFLPTTLAEAVKIKNEHSDLRIISGATDLGVLSNKGKTQLIKLMSLHLIEELYQMKNMKNTILIGAKNSLDEVEKITQKDFPEFSKLLHIFASPQIKNNGTLVGNALNASPIADTIPFLKVSQAQIVLQSVLGERTLNMNDFYLAGYKQLDIKPNEIVTKIILPKTKKSFKLYKISARRDLDISAVTMAVSYQLEKKTISNFAIAFGGVAASVIRLPEIEKMLEGKTFTSSLFKQVAETVSTQLKPLSDVRGSDVYRQLVCKNLVLKFCDEVHAEEGWKRNEVLV
ncbi:MAG: FAD binding domain-containing protein [Bacteriovoracaceae bacterium]|nr:FAD binding domain-containing protein [Bacteriovoracaceae bacterium]